MLPWQGFFFPAFSLLVHVPSFFPSFSSTYKYPHVVSSILSTRSIVVATPKNDNTEKRPKCTYMSGDSHNSLTASPHPSVLLALRLWFRSLILRYRSLRSSWICVGHSPKYQGLTWALTFSIISVHSWIS